MKRCTPEQIVQVLREAEISRSQETTEEFCRRKGISTVSYYRWRDKYGGLEVMPVRCISGLSHGDGVLRAGGSVSRPSC